jgi:hypothetical protein
VRSPHRALLQILETGRRPGKGAALIWDDTLGSGGPYSPSLNVCSSISVLRGEGLEASHWQLPLVLPRVSVPGLPYLARCPSCGWREERGGGGSPAGRCELAGGRVGVQGRGVGIGWGSGWAAPCSDPFHTRPNADTVSCSLPFQ